MKYAFIIVGIILAGILMIVLILNNSPDLLNYKINDNSSRNYINTSPPLPKLELHLQTEPANFWNQVKKINENDQTSSEESENISEAQISAVPENADMPPVPVSETPAVTTSKISKYMK